MTEELNGGEITDNLAAGDGLDRLDRKLLDIIQSGFPLESRPYAVLGEKLGLGEEETLERVKALRRRKIIRRLGANFQSSRLGFRSTLCAAKVLPEKMETFVAAVNSHPGITHNYLRDHAYNVWFTMIGPSWEDVCRDLDRISAETGVKILNLPARRMYKIKVDFKVDEE